MIVLDSHIWFWWINQEHHRFPALLLHQIENADRVGVSPVSCFELALAHKKDRLELPIPPSEWFGLALHRSDVELLPFSEKIALCAVGLTDIHRDPFDRIIIATALQLEAQLASLDGLFGSYPELNGCLLS